MKHLSKNLLGAALIAFTGLTAQAQDKNSGVIDYEVNQKMPPRGGDGDEEGQVITINQHFFFAAGKGKLETERPNFGGRGRQDGPPPGGPGGEGGAPPEGGPDGGGQGGGRPRFRGPGAGMMGGGFVDLAAHKYLQTFNSPDDSTKTFFAEEDFHPAKDAKPADKTKKIAGYNCKKATVTVRDETYTVWYTNELPFSYSPVNGLLPEPNGVVLAAESSNRSFTAKKVDFKPVPAEKVSLPGNAEKVSEEDLRKMRHEAMQKFRDRQNRN